MEKGEPNVASLREAAERVFEIYLANRENSEARQYLTSVGVNVLTADKFTIGYAPSTPDLLSKSLPGDVHSDALEEMGLAYSHRDGRTDLFQRSLVFPIRNHRGSLSGFAGLRIDEPGVGYAYNADNKLFQRDTSFYALDTALQKIISRKRAFVFQDPLEVLIAYENGVDNAISSCGRFNNSNIDFITGIFPEEQLIFCFDNKKPLLGQDIEVSGILSGYENARILFYENGGLKGLHNDEGERFTHPLNYYIQKQLQIANPQRVAEHLALLNHLVRGLANNGADIKPDPITVERRIEDFETELEMPGLDLQEREHRLGPPGRLEEFNENRTRESFFITSLLADNTQKTVDYFLKREAISPRLRLPETRAILEFLGKRGMGSDEPLLYAPLLRECTIDSIIERINRPSGVKLNNRFIASLFDFAKNTLPPTFEDLQKAYTNIRALRIRDRLMRVERRLRESDLDGLQEIIDEITEEM